MIQAVLVEPYVGPDAQAYNEALAAKNLKDEERLAPGKERPLPVHETSIPFYRAVANTAFRHGDLVTLYPVDFLTTALGTMNNKNLVGYAGGEMQSVEITLPETVPTAESDAAAPWKGEAITCFAVDGTQKHRYRRVGNTNVPNLVDLIARETSPWRLPNEVLLEGGGFQLDYYGPFVRDGSFGVDTYYELNARYEKKHVEASGSSSEEEEGEDLLGLAREEDSRERAMIRADRELEAEAERENAAMIERKEEEDRIRELRQAEKERQAKIRRQAFAQSLREDNDLPVFPEEAESSDSESEASVQVPLPPDTLLDSGDKTAKRVPRAGNCAIYMGAGRHGTGALFSQHPHKLVRILSETHFEYEVGAGRQCCLLMVALKDIEPGEELLCTRDASYWDHSLEVDLGLEIDAEEIDDWRENFATVGYVTVDDLYEPPREAYVEPGTLKEQRLAVEAAKDLERRAKEAKELQDLRRAAANQGDDESSYGSDDVVEFETEEEHKDRMAAEDKAMDDEITARMQREKEEWARNQTPKKEAEDEIELKVSEIWVMYNECYGNEEDAHDPEDELQELRKRRNDELDANPDADIKQGVFKELREKEEAYEEQRLAIRDKVDELKKMLAEYHKTFDEEEEELQFSGEDEMPAAESEEEEELGGIGSFDLI